MSIYIYMYTYLCIYPVYNDFNLCKMGTSHF